MHAAPVALRVGLFLAVLLWPELTCSGFFGDVAHVRGVLFPDNLQVS